MKYVAIGWTRSGVEVYLNRDGAWIKEKYAGLVEGVTGNYHTVPIAVFDSEIAANEAIDRSDEITSCRAIQLTKDIIQKLSNKED